MHWETQNASAPFAFFGQFRAHFPTLSTASGSFKIGSASRHFQGRPTNRSKRSRSWVNPVTDLDRLNTTLSRKIFERNLFTRWWIDFDAFVYLSNTFFYFSPLLSPLVLLFDCCSGYLRKRRSLPHVRMKAFHSTWKTSTNKHWALPPKRSWSTWQVTYFWQNPTSFRKNKNKKGIKTKIRGCQTDRRDGGGRPQTSRRSGWRWRIDNSLTSEPTPFAWFLYCSYSGIPLDDESGPVPRLAPQQG